MDHEKETNRLDLKIIQCFRDEIEEARKDNKEIYAEHGIIKEKLSHLPVLQENFILLNAKVAVLEKDGEHLSGRLERHSVESKESYKELKVAFKNLTEDLEGFKTDVLRRLDTMSGRDSVLKLLFGALAGGIIVWIVESVMGVINAGV